MGRDKSIPVPFVQQMIAGSLEEDGKAIGMTGEIKKHTFSSSSFSFALTTGPNIEGGNLSDFAVLVNYREKTGWVVNQYIDGAWKTEDRYPAGDGVEPGSEVYIRIAPFNDYFKIFVNGEKLGERSYIVPISAINYVAIFGDVELHRLQFESNFYMVPFFLDFTSFTSGHSLYVSGKANSDASSFSISLEKDEKNVPFLFNPRFSENDVVRNTMTDGDWGEEEKSGGFPFTKGQVFDLIFNIMDEGYVVYVNGSKFCTYANRSAVKDVKQLHVYGDVELSSVHYK